MLRVINLVLVLISIACYSCKHKTAASQDEHELLAADESELQEAYRSQQAITNKVYPAIETDPVEAESADDAADDPAIWYNSANPSESVVYGSNKKGGIVAYNLEGTMIKYYPVGNVNNVDVTYGFYYNGRKIDMLGCSNRSTQGIDIFEIAADGSLVNISANMFLMDTALVDDIYGFCFGISADGRHYALMNAKNGLVHQYEMVLRDTVLALELVREVQLESQPEGMVVSNARQQLYIGEEQKGIWLLDLDPASETKSLLQDSGEENKNIKYDIEGLTIMKTANEEWLIASSQGNFSYAVYDIANAHRYLGSFVIADHEGIDGAEETDGIDVITDSLSTRFPHGVFIAQDGFNYSKESKVAQNFKYVDTREVAVVLK